MGGGAKSLLGGTNATPGLSPRGRGSLGLQNGRGGCSRSIPAWAGEPRRRDRRGIRAAVYPRVGGGASGPLTAGAWVPGLSPRGRGSLSADRLLGRTNGSIPAWAGEPARTRQSPVPGQVYPRVGGGATSMRIGRANPWGLSPRGRGSRSTSKCRHQPPRSIPAWAGEPARRAATAARDRVYPRVGGGASVGAVHLWRRGGLSPRGRGSPMGYRFDITP